MKVFLRTWRYTMVTTQGYHGNAVKVDAANMLLHIVEPVIAADDGGPDVIGDLTCVTITAGDEFTVMPCVNCEQHPNEPLAEKTVGFIPEPLDRLRGRF